MVGKLLSLFKSTPTEPPKAGPQLAMPLFPKSEPLDFSAIPAVWAALYPDKPALKHQRADGKVDTFTSGDQEVAAVHIPMPVPKAVEIIRTSWMWQQPDDVIQAHRSHAIVTAMPSGKPVADATLVACFCAAALKAFSGVALYWGSGRQMLPPAVVEAMTTELEGPPVMLWIGLTISGDSKTGPFSATTHGLEALGHKEFEVRGTRMGIGELRGNLYRFASYVLESGPVLKHGQTIGPDANTHWKVSHEPSKLVPGRDVIVLGIP